MKSLLPVLFLVLLLPVVTVVALLATRVTPRAYLPISRPLITPIPPQKITPTAIPLPSTTAISTLQITTTTLTTGRVNKPYYAGIEAKSPNLGDVLTLSISGLPFGLNQGPCAAPISTGGISCSITGTPAGAGLYAVRITVTDNHGGSATKSFSLTVLGESVSGSPVQITPGGIRTNL